MEIDYNKIDKVVNKYAIDVIYDILEKYSNYLNEEEKDIFIEKITNNRIIIVDKPNPEDENFFHGDIPTAHGPRAKGDGFIHIYPYRFNNLSTDEIIKSCIDHIIIHELYHYIIKLDIKGDFSPDEIDFGHYITEGMVQLFAELHQGQSDRTSKYRKNIDNAKIIYEACKENPSLIFHHNYKDILARIPELTTIYENFIKEKDFTSKLNKLLTEIGPIINWEPKRLIAKAKSFGINDTLINLKELMEKKMSKEESKEYCSKLDEIYISSFEQNKKSLY